MQLIEINVTESELINPLEADKGAGYDKGKVSLRKREIVPKNVD